MNFEGVVDLAPANQNAPIRKNRNFLLFKWKFRIPRRLTQLKRESFGKPSLFGSMTRTNIYLWTLLEAQTD